MERFETPVNCDNASRPVMVRAVGCPSHLMIPSHSHGRAELVYVSSGSLCLTANDVNFTVPSQHAILIPAGTVHDMRMLTDTFVVTLYISMPPARRRIRGCQNIPVSGLLRELMNIAVNLPTDYDADGRDGRIMDLITEEAVWLISQPRTPTLQTPVPKDIRLLGVCQQLLRELDRAWTIDEVALAAGMGRRTFTRTFKREMGVSFSTWLLHARLNAAVSLLSAGASITEVAFESGYNSPSAFATMFKRCLGVPPSAYQGGVTVNPTSMEGCGNPLPERAPFHQMMCA